MKQNVLSNIQTHSGFWPLITQHLCATTSYLDFQLFLRLLRPFCISCAYIVNGGTSYFFYLSRNWRESSVKLRESSCTVCYFLPDFNRTGISSTELSTNPQCTISRKYVQWELSSSTRTKRMDRHDEVHCRHVLRTHLKGYRECPVHYPANVENMVSS